VSGIFSVDPQSGIELLTTFNVAASMWYDLDLPLSYAFGFIANSGSLVMSSISETPYVDTIYAAGQDINGFNVTTVVQIFDAFHSYTTAKASVTVRKSGTALSPSSLLSLGAVTITPNCTYMFLYYPALPCAFAYLALHRTHSLPALFQLSERSFRQHWWHH
jgi:REJ domain